MLRYTSDVLVANSRGDQLLRFDVCMEADTESAADKGPLPLALVAEHTKRIKMGPSVAIAFPRSPMTMAYTAWDLAGMSDQRIRVPGGQGLER